MVILIIKGGNTYIEQFATFSSLIFLLTKCVIRFVNL